MPPIHSSNIVEKKELNRELKLKLQLGENNTITQRQGQREEKKCRR